MNYAMPSPSAAETAYEHVCHKVNEIASFVFQAWPFDTPAHAMERWLLLRDKCFEWARNELAAYTALSVDDLAIMKDEMQRAYDCNKDNQIYEFKQCLGAYMHVMLRNIERHSQDEKPYYHETV